MKFKFLFFHLLCIVSSLAFSQPSDSKLKESIEVAIALKHVSAAPFAGHLLEGDFIYDDKNNLIGKHARYYEFDGQSNEGGFKNSEKVVIYPRSIKDHISSVEVVGSKCDISASNLMWEGQKISGTYQDDFIFNKFRKVTAVKDKVWGKKGKEWVRNVFELKYDNLGRLVSIEQKKEFGKGKSYADISLKYSSLYTTKIIEYLDKKVTKIVVKSYNKKEKNKIQDIKYVRSIIINESDNQIKIDFFQDGNLLGVKEINFDGNMIVSNKIIDPADRSYEMTTYNYNDIGFVDKDISKSYNENAELVEHYENNYKYSLKDKETRNIRLACKYDVKINTFQFDLEGNVKREISGSKFRDKLPDGTWSAWKQMTY